MKEVCSLSSRWPELWPAFFSVSFCKEMTFISKTSFRKNEKKEVTHWGGGGGGGAVGYFAPPPPHLPLAYCANLWGSTPPPLCQVC